MTAIEQYKAILQQYPDRAGKTARAYFRLASSYEAVQFSYEAAGALERLIVTYPNSQFAPDALFKLGDLLRRIGKYSRAIERFIAYLNRYPDRKYCQGNVLRPW